MSIITDRLNANKPPPPATDPKTGKLAPGAINNNKDLDVDAKKEEPSFFGSFFTSSSKNGRVGGAKKAGGSSTPSTMEAPPAVIKPQAALSERETIETEVISTYCSILTCPVSFSCPLTMLLHTELLIHSYFNIVKREMIDMVPKAITLTLVNHAKETLQRELLQELYKQEVLDDLLKESEYVVSRRKEVIGMVAALNKAEEYVLLCLFMLTHQTKVGSCDVGSLQVSRGSITYHASFVRSPLYFTLSLFVIFCLNTHRTCLDCIEY